MPTRCGARKSGTSCCCHRQGQSPHCPHLSSASAAPPRRSCAAGFSKTTRGQTRSKTSCLACTNFFPLNFWKQYHADLAGDRATKKNRKKNRIAHHRISPVGGAGFSGACGLASAWRVQATTLCSQVFSKASRSLFSVVFLCPSVCLALKLRSLHSTHPVCVASRYF